jgi:hypothetical protein
MSKVLSVLDDAVTALAQLQVPTYAAAAAGALAPVILGVFGDNFPPQTIAGWLVLVGGVCAALEKALAPKPAGK